MSVTLKQPSPATTDAEPADPARDLTEEERRQRQIGLNQPIIALINSWMEEDLAATDEDDEAFEKFQRNIDAFRLPGSKLYS